MTDVYFFFDHDRKSGMGHYKRCAAIAKELSKKKIKSHFITFSNKREEEKLKYFRLIHYNKLNIKLVQNLPLIIDSYSITQARLKKLNFFFKRIFCIEDEPSKKFLKNYAVINSGYGIKKINYNKKSFQKIYTGIGYKFVKNNFLKKYLKSKNKKDITISFGGGKVLERVIFFLDAVFNCLEEIAFKEKIFLFLNLNSSDKKKLINKYSNLNIKIYSISDKYYEKILRSKFVISSCGVQQDELICWRIPSIFLQIADNQKYNYFFIKKIDRKICYKSSQFKFKKLNKLLYNIVYKNYDNKIINKFKKTPLGFKTKMLLDDICREKI